MSKGTIEPCLGLLVKGMCSLLINTVDTIFERESLSNEVIWVMQNIVLVDISHSRVQPFKKTTVTELILWLLVAA